MSLKNVLTTIWKENEGLDKYKYFLKGIGWQIRKRLGHDFVTKLPNGANMKVYPTSAYSGIFYSELPEKKDLLFFRKNAYLGDCFVDVGANVGGFSVYLFDVFDRFIMFEPSPSSFNALKETCGLNPSINCEIFNIGIGDVKGKLEFLDEDEYSTTSRFVNSEYTPINGTIRKMAVDTLDNKLSNVSH